MNPIRRSMFKAFGLLAVMGGLVRAPRALAQIKTTYRLASSAASTNADRVKATPGMLYHMQGINNAAYAIFIVLYDSTANPPVPGTTTIRKKIAVPAGPNLGFTFDWPGGLQFTSGIGLAFTKLVADSDTTALASADVTAFNIDYV